MRNKKIEENMKDKGNREKKKRNKKTRKRGATI